MILGLQLWDWMEGCWMNLEEQAPTRHMIIFGGETLGKYVWNTDDNNTNEKPE